MVLETAGLNSTELGAYCRERGLFPEHLDRWRQAAHDANAQPLLTMAEQKDLEKRHQTDQREIKRLQQELRRKDKALAEAAALLIASKRSRPTGERTRGMTSPADRRKALEVLDATVDAGARAHEVAALLGVGLTTLQRWRRQFAGDGDGLDGRKGSPHLVSHRLTDEERQRILLTCSEPEFAALPPGNRGRSCRSLRIGASISARSAAFTAFSMPMVRPIAVAVPGRPRSYAQCRDWRPEGRISSGAGTSPTCPPARAD